MFVWIDLFVMLVFMICGWLMCVNGCVVGVVDYVEECV